MPATSPTNNLTYKDLLLLFNAVRQMTQVLQSFIDGSLEDLDNDLQDLIAQSVLTLNGSINQLALDINTINTTTLPALDSSLRGYVDTEVATKIGDAPSDGTKYVRQDGAWVPA